MIILKGLATLASPIVGIIGLGCTGVRTLHDCVQTALAQRKYDQCDKDSEIGKLCKRRLIHYQTRLSENLNYGKTFGLLSIPLFGFPIAYVKGYAKASALNAAVDIASHWPHLLTGRVFKELYPCSGVSLADYTKMFYEDLDADYEAFAINQRKLWVQKNNGQMLNIKTPDDRTLDAVWVPGDRAKSNGPTIVLFHGNNGILDSMQEWMKFYKKQGLNVLMVTMGGYPSINPQTVPTSELTSYLDAQACADYLKTLGVKNQHTYAHGYSIGSTLAVQFGKINPGSHIIVERGLSSIRRIFQNVVQLEDKVNINVARLPIKRAVRLILPKEKYGNIETNRLNNRKKLKDADVDLLVMQGQYDDLMLDSPYKLYKTFKEATSQIATHVMFEGSHTTPINYHLNHLKDPNNVKDNKQKKAMISFHKVKIELVTFLKATGFTPIAA